MPGREEDGHRILR